GSTAVCGPVARVRRLRRNPGMYGDKYIGAASSPAALRLPGLRVRRRLRAGSPDRRSAPPPGNPAELIFARHLRALKAAQLA
ncbi:hypothetical protein, partial [Klebsiella michiganensis]